MSKMVEHITLFNGEVIEVDTNKSYAIGYKALTNNPVKFSSVKEHLEYIIKHKDEGCWYIPCEHCPFKKDCEDYMDYYRKKYRTRTLSPLPSETLYEKSVEKYIELFGIEKLVEFLL